MTAPAAASNAPAPPTLDIDDRLRIAGDVVQHRLSGTTPARYRLWSLATLAVLGLATLATWWATTALVDASDRARDNTAPVLVATQDVFASIAEADAASASVFLSGTDEDPQQRRLYEVALTRATAQLEEVSRLVGDDDAAHDSIKSIAADLTTYSGLVESARTATVNGVPGASDTLLAAIGTVQSGIVPEVQALTERAQASLDDDATAGRSALAVAIAAIVVALAVLVVGQLHLRRRTKRMVNVPLAAATMLLVVLGVWLLSSWSAREGDFDSAREGGYDSIALTGEIQTSAFRYKTLESLALLGAGDTTEQSELATALSAVVIDDALVSDARSGRAGGDGLLLQANRSADSTREQAATSELLVRWNRYLQTSQDIRLAIESADRAAAVDLATLAGNSDFNGFNTAVESVLSDNRSQFLDGVADARNRLDFLRIAAILLPVLAALLALWGWQLRINEYRR